jgi:hypothetical protein
MAASNSGLALFLTCCDRLLSALELRFRLLLLFYLYRQVSCAAEARDLALVSRTKAIFFLRRLGTLKIHEIAALSYPELAEHH